MSLPPRFTRPAEWPFQKIGDEIVVVVPRARLMHRIEGVGVRIWELLERPATVASLVSALESEFEVERETLEADVVGFLEELRGRELLEPA